MAGPSHNRLLVLYPPPARSDRMSPDLGCVHVLCSPSARRSEVVASSAGLKVYSIVSRVSPLLKSTLKPQEFAVLSSLAIPAEKRFRLIFEVFEI